MPSTFDSDPVRAFPAAHEPTPLRIVDKVPLISAFPVKVRLPLVPTLPPYGGLSGMWLMAES